MLKYKREVDGLRAVAVLAVILFHAGFNAFKGGYVGVDVFFVISGFLITSIVLQELGSNSFSIVSFYERRARRILPALFFMMAVTIPAAWLILFPKDLESYFASLSAIPLFKANHFFMADTEYFAVASELKPLLHTWSLAVEEQYYIIFPFLILLFGNRLSGKKIILIVLIVLGFGSLLRAEFLSTREISENFFLLPTRFWEISVGSFIAFLPKKILNISIGRRQLVSVLGFLLILYSIFIFDNETPFPSLYTLVPVFGTALVIMYAGEDTYIGKLLGVDVLVSIGLISYSAYLWHQPIFALSRYKLHQDYLNAWGMSFLILISLALAWVSWRFIEVPFKSKTRFKRSVVFSLSIAVSVMFILTGLFFSKIFKSYGMEAVTAQVLAKHGIVYAQGISDERLYIKERIRVETKTPDVLIIGSSRIMQINEVRGFSHLILGVSGASVEDDLAMMYLADNKINPKMVLISADPWLFNSKSEQNRWKTLEPEYLKAMGLVQANNDGEYNTNSTKKRIIESVRDFYASTTFSQSAPTTADRELKAKIRYDGFRIYDLAYATKSQKDIEAEFDSLLSYAMSPYVPSQQAKDEFQKLVKDQVGKRRVGLILTPYHPKMYARMKNENPIFLRIEDEYRKFAKANGIAVIGSYDPEKMGCLAREFYDGMHPTGECMSKVMSGLKEQKF